MILEQVLCNMVTMSQLDTEMKPARMYVDFNEMIEDDLVLLSQSDTKQDSSGRVVHLCEGLTVHVYMDDTNKDGEVDNLIADGVVELHTGVGWGTVAKWCCRIDSKGIRHESEEME